MITLPKGLAPMAKTYTQISPLLVMVTWNHFKRSTRCAPDRTSRHRAEDCHAQRCSKGQSGYSSWHSLRIHQGLAGEWRAHKQRFVSWGSSKLLSCVPSL